MAEEITFAITSQCATGHHVRLDVTVNGKTRNIGLDPEFLGGEITDGNVEDFVRVLIRLLGSGLTYQQVKNGLGNRKVVLTTVPV